jgi:hypothetical protein
VMCLLPAPYITMCDFSFHNLSKESISYSSENIQE